VNKTRSSFEHISTVVIQSEIWSIDNDFLTPTLKVKRQIINQRFSDLYLKWHQNDSAILWV